MDIRWLVVPIFCLVMISAIAAVYSKHQNRREFVSLLSLQNQRDELNVEWGRLQLEQSTWATHARVEGIARQQLEMKNPLINEVVVIKP